MTDQELIRLAQNASWWKMMSEWFTEAANGSIKIEGREPRSYIPPPAFKVRLEEAAEFAEQGAELHELLKAYPAKVEDLQEREEAVTKTKKELADDIAKHDFNVEKFASDILRKYRAK